MKNKIAILILLPALLLITGVNQLYGQGFSSQGTAAIDANVVGAIQVTNLSDINFGLISQNINTTAPVLDPQDSGSDENIVDDGNVSVGKFVFEAASEQSIIFTFSAATLTEDGGADELEFTPSIQGSQGDETAPNDGARGGDTAISNNDSVLLTGTHYTVWVGGTLGLGGSTTAPVNVGAYDGTFTITVDYDI
ncbi:MAG: DUF4402 domain-containing protein [Balneolaceae bacterium]